MALLAQHPASVDLPILLGVVATLALLAGLAAGIFRWAYRSRCRSAADDPLHAKQAQTVGPSWQAGVLGGGSAGLVVAVAAELLANPRWTFPLLLLAGIVGALHGQWMGAALTAIVRAWPAKRRILIGLVAGATIGALVALFSDRGPGGQLAPLVFVSISIAAGLGGAVGAVVALIHEIRLRTQARHSKTETAVATDAASGRDDDSRG